LDPKEVVIDEVVGVWIALFFVKFFTPEASDLLTFSLSFLLFRFFDILKPFPISYLDKNLKNALGVMLDDVLAGIFAGICTVLLIKVL
jgi:phosphatidylglycerophosphatase A